MSRAQAIETSKARLAANFFIAIPVAVVLAVIWKFQTPKPAAVEGWGSPELPL